MDSFGILIGNIITVLIVVLIAVFIFRARKSVFWRDVVRQISRRKLAVISLFIMVIYLLIALFDSFSWADPKYDEEGHVIIADNGVAVMDYPLSLLDRILSPIRTAQETTFSAPFGTRSLVKTTYKNEMGEIVRDYPALKYPGVHVLGTDKVGNDVLYATLKAIRTAMIIGIFPILIALPFALFLGVMAGYFGRWVDDVIVFIYTMISGIPGILLIAAFMIIFGQGVVQLCVVMGITAWVGLCRLLRGETYKLREIEYVQAAKAFGVSSVKIIVRHLFPNVMHLVLISFVLWFSGNVLAETFLSYIGIGVGSQTPSWGNMINEGRFELSREPVVWWNLAAAFFMMFGLVLPTNLFGDALRDALDPKLRQ
jgi:peptide/nickel transport system permease protein